MDYMMFFEYITLIVSIQSDWISQYRRYMLHDVLMTRAEHEAYCVSQYNTHLASIHCQEEEDELVILVAQKDPDPDDKRAYIGYMVNDTQWIDGTAITYQDTLAISGDGPCMELLINPSLIPRWNDLYCDRKQFGLCNYAKLDTINNCQSVIPQNLYTLHEYFATWHASENLCLFNYGTNLASIHSTDDQTAAILETPAIASWIGLNDILVEDEWTWTDGTAWNYGTIYNKTPWAPFQPDNWQTNEHCAHIKNDGNWNDQPCHYKIYALCGYPQPIQIINDPSNYIRIPFVNNSIGVVDVLDEIHIEFDIIFTSWPAATTWGNILHIGDDALQQRFPAIFIYGDQYFHTSFSTITEPNVAHNSDNIGPLSLGKSYRYMLHQTQDSVDIIVDGATVYNGYIDSHAIIKDRTLYLGNPWNTRENPDFDIFNATITNLFISTSNSYFSGFNYNCDATNRWGIVSGTWILDDSACTVTQTDGDWDGAIVWLGSVDPSSIQWIDYKIETTFRFLSVTAQEAGILVRAQTVSTTNDYGKQYSFSARYDLQQVIFSIKNNSHTVVTSQAVTINSGIDYILRVEASGNIFNVYWNHAFLFTVTDSSFGYGSVGLRTWNATATFTSIRIIFPTDNYLYTVPPTTQPTTPTTQPTPFPSTTPTIALFCPVGSTQIGGNNADVVGCGLDICTDRYNKQTISDCLLHCITTTNCTAFNWSPIGGDKNHLDTTVCTIYDTESPIQIWTPNTILCRKDTDAPTTIPTNQPTAMPTIQPTIYPSFNPTLHPTINPTFNPTLAPTINPTKLPTTYEPTTGTPTTSVPTASPIMEGNVGDETTTFVTSESDNVKEHNEKISSGISNYYLFTLILVVSIIVLLLCCICILVFSRNKKRKQYLEGIDTVCVEMNKTMSVASNIVMASEGDQNEMKPMENITITSFTPHGPMNENGLTNNVMHENVSDMALNMPLPPSSVDLVNTNDNEDDSDEDQNLYDQGPESPRTTESPGGTETVQ